MSMMSSRLNLKRKLNDLFSVPGKSGLLSIVRESITRSMVPHLRDFVIVRAELIVDVAVTRIEQFHPFPFVSVKNNIESYPNLESIVWAQEEHLNAGGWTFVQPRLQTLLKETKFSGMEVTYAGRGPSAR
jgi:hypothetical protein